MANSNGNGPSVSAADMIRSALENARKRGSEAVIESTWGPVGREHVLIPSEVLAGAPWPKVAAVLVAGWDENANPVCGATVYRPVPKHVAMKLSELLKREVLMTYKGRREPISGGGKKYHDFSIAPLKPDEGDAGPLELPGGETLELAFPETAAPALALALEHKK